ncbi:MAG TPA: hypothetical protein VNM92_13340, partial [Thermoanaerobaculia bacterium]|nr:hypothetical protein [Thermoanaerobaculia bacterium]
RIIGDYRLPTIRRLIEKYYPKLVEEVSAAYKDRALVNLSHWDPSSEFASVMASTLRPPDDGSAIPYLYSPGDADLSLAMEVTGIRRSSVITTASTTASIAAVLFWLATRARSLLVVAPSYFTVGLLAEALGFDVTFATLRRTQSGYELPDLPDADAIWITNPTYCTTHYFSDEQLRFFRSWLERQRPVIADEAMAFPGTNAGSYLAPHRLFIGMYSPHKAIGINGLKCSLIACDETVRPELLEVFDAFVGGLPISTMTAVAHLATPNFRKCSETYVKYVSRAYERVSEAVRQYDHVELDRFALTSFVSAFVPTVPASAGSDRTFLVAGCERASAIAFPATIHGYGPEAGFGFRLNLTAVDDKFIAALHRWCQYLEQAKC